MKIGKAMETVILDLAQEQLEKSVFRSSTGWSLMEMFGAPGMATSLDGYVVEDGIKVPVEAKNVDHYIHARDWADGEAPLHIELQLQMQMMMSGAGHGYLACLAGGNEFTLVKRKVNLKLQKVIITKVAAFWESVEKQKAPPINPGPVDLSVLKELLGLKGIEDREVRVGDSTINRAALELAAVKA